MGAQLAGRAYAFAAERDLKPNEARLLVWMALHALDGDKSPRYFMARESSALALGRLVPDRSDPGDPDAEAIDATRSAAFQRVKIATQGLVRSGAIKSTRRGREGARAEYALVFGAHHTGTENEPLGSTHNEPHSESENVPGGVRGTYPKGTTEDYKEPGRGITPPHSTISPAPVDKSIGSAA